MFFVSYDIGEKILERVAINISQPCSHCQANTANLDVVKFKVSALYEIVRHQKIKIYLTCTGCNKKIKKKYWSEDVRFLAKQKAKEYKLSFFQKYGRSLVLCVAIIGFFFGFLIYQDMATAYKGKRNFTKAYGEDASRIWYESLEEGDFLLCNKTYNNPVQVHQIVRFSGDTVVVKVYDQYFPYGSYEESGKLNKLPLGEATYTLQNINKKDLRRHGYVKDVSEGGLSLKYLNTVQIKKNKQ